MIAPLLITIIILLLVLPYIHFNDMLSIIKFTSIMAIACMAMAAPTTAPINGTTITKRDSVTVTLKNKCDFALNVHKLTNGEGDPSGTYKLSSDGSRDVKLDSQWKGRFWGCKEGDKTCEKYGSASSLAEFLFSGFEGQDFYDISFVDGFNFPMRIEPHSSDAGSGYDCGAPTCSSLPDCPEDLKNKDGSCRSACAAFGTDEYCCTGKYNGDNKCPENKYSRHFKAGCPDAYSFAYDDAKSTFACSSTTYTVTFCP